MKLLNFLLPTLLPCIWKEFFAFQDKIWWEIYHKSPFSLLRLSALFQSKSELNLLIDSENMGLRKYYTVLENNSYPEHRWRMFKLQLGFNVTQDSE